MQPEYLAAVCPVRASCVPSARQTTLRVLMDHKSTVHLDCFLTTKLQLCVMSLQSSPIRGCASIDRLRPPVRPAAVLLCVCALHHILLVLMCEVKGQASLSRSPFHCSNRWVHVCVCVCWSSLWRNKLSCRSGFYFSFSCFSFSL